MVEREKNIRLWFDMWLQKRDLGILDLFSADTLYIRSDERRVGKECM